MLDMIIQKVIEHYSDRLDPHAIDFLTKQGEYRTRIEALTSAAKADSLPEYLVNEARTEQIQKTFNSASENRAGMIAMGFMLPYMLELTESIPDFDDQETVESFSRDVDRQVVSYNDSMEAFVEAAQGVLF